MTGGADPVLRVQRRILDMAGHPDVTVAESLFKPGDVVRYTPGDRFDRWWCREGKAVAQRRDGGAVFLADTYWAGSGVDNHILTDGELATAELLFNVADYDELQSRPGVKETWEKFAPADRETIPSQHGLQHRWYVRKGASEDLPTQVENARERLAEARQKASSAQYGVEWAERELAEVEAKLAGGAE